MATRVSSSSAARGPHSPARYGSGAVPAQACSSGSITRQLCSTSAASGKSVRSPMSTSSTSRSYASGLDSVKASPYWKSIAMSRTSMVVPGTLEPNLITTPSSGWTRMTSWLLPSISMSAARNGRCGAFLNMMATSVTRRGSRLPARM